MFKNKIKKQKKFDILEQNDNQKEDEDDDVKLENQVKKKVKTEFNSASTKEINSQYKTQTDQLQDELKYQAKRGVLSSAAGNAYAENEIDTSADQDAKAIALRNIKISQDIKSGKLSKKFYHGASQDYLGRTEQQIASKKFTGTCGPLRAPTNIRVTCRFDYNPSLCKDWHDTGYCVFGDSCIYIHDRGDYKSGWEMEKEFEQEYKQRLTGKNPQQQQQQDEEPDEDGIFIPKICQICDQKLKHPIVTRCEHYFCEKCALNQHKQNPNCFTCNKPTNGIFNDAIQIINKLKDQKRQIVGGKLSSDEEDGQNNNNLDDDELQENNIIIDNKEEQDNEKEENKNGEETSKVKNQKIKNKKNEEKSEMQEKIELEKLSKEFKKKQQEQKIKNVTSTSDWSLN